MSPSSALEISRQTLLYLAPEVLLTVAAVAMITAGAFVKQRRSTWAVVSALALLAVLIAMWITGPMLGGGRPDPYAAVVSNDALANFGRLLVVLGGFIVLGLVHGHVEPDRAAEFYGSLLLLHAGAMVICSANELVLLFVGLELVSIPTYVLLYMPRRTALVQEAAAKYFFLSIFSSALLLFGLAYLYGLAGTSNLKALAYLVHWPDGKGHLQLPQPLFATVALVFIMAGLCFRVAAVPFHFYAPDVYQGTTLPLAALLAWVPKLIGFVAMLRVLTAVFGWQPTGGGVGVEVSNLTQVSDRAVQLTWVLAVVSMVLGNTVALAQDDLKRLLAYSSIAHAGYLLAGVAAAFRNAAGGAAGVLGADAVIFYLATYAFMTLGAFGVIIWLNSRDRPVERVDDLSGLWTTHPRSALALVICLFSLAGIPPLAGFWGKLRIFQSVLEVGRGDDAGLFQSLAVIGVLSAAIGAYYYLRIIVVMMFGESIDRPRPRRNFPAALAAAMCAVLSVLLGLPPGLGMLTDASRAAGAAAVALPEPDAPRVPMPDAVSPLAPEAAPRTAADA